MSNISTSQILWTSSDAAKATGGKAVGDWSVTGLSIDTRTIRDGDLFVPLKDIRDGHAFIPQARTAGAGAVLSEHADEGQPALIVDDTLMAMRDLAIAARTRSQATRIAITGSVGKTSLKEAISTICASHGKTHKSLKSFNNHWGVPLTLATLPQDTQYGVFELGMNHAGELADLSPLVAPHIAVITKIAPAHLAHFKDVDAIAAAKSEIFQGLAADGTAVLNADDDYFEFLRQQVGDVKVLSFGYAENADIRLSYARITATASEARLDVDGKTYELKINLGGAHWLENAACAIAATFAAGIDPEISIQALSTLHALPGRGDLFTTEIAGVDITILDESYNANPESMRASIQTLGQQSGRKLAILGDMFELGKDELALHAALAPMLVEAGVSRVITVGECMRALKGALPQPLRGPWAKNWQIALTSLEHEVQDGDTVLIKGSNATGLGKLVSEIRKTAKGNSHVL